MKKNNITVSQFMHLELYSRTGIKIKNNITKTSADAVVKEALRVEGFVSHIRSDGYIPKPPTYLYQADAMTLDRHYEIMLQKVETEKDALNRKIKSDKNILLAGVVSYPKPWIDGQNAKNWTDDDYQNYQLFISETVDFLKKQFGENLLNILEHKDEKYPHLHFYIADRKRVSSTPELHPGQAENIRLERAAKEKNIKCDKKAATKAYRDAMRMFQDSYYEQVGKLCGLDRLGPKAQRLTYSEWKIRKINNKNIAKAAKKLKDELLKQENDKKVLNQKMIELEQAIAENNKASADNEELAQYIDKNMYKIELADWIIKNEPKAHINYKNSKMQKPAENLKPTKKL